jgi:hypothetical protein
MGGGGYDGTLVTGLTAVPGPDDVVQRSQPIATRDTISQWIMRGSRPRGMGRIARCTNPSFGTKSRNSTCGRTNMIPS